MKKSDIIKQIDKYTNYSQKDIKLVIEYFLDAIMEGLIKDERIELRRLGIFLLKKKPSKMVINPRTGVQTLVSERYLPHFKMGKYIKKELNKHQANAKKV